MQTHGYIPFLGGVAAPLICGNREALTIGEHSPEIILILSYFRFKIKKNFLLDRFNSSGKHQIIQAQ